MMMKQESGTQLEINLSPKLEIHNLKKQNWLPRHGFLCRGDVLNICQSAVHSSCVLTLLEFEMKNRTRLSRDRRVTGFVGKAAAVGQQNNAQKMGTKLKSLIFRGKKKKKKKRLVSYDSRL